MLLDLREKIRSSKPIKYGIITVISVPFVLVGVGSYFSGGAAAPVAEVNGTAISRQQLDQAYQQQRSQLARMFGGRVPEGFASEPLLREQALQQLVTQNVIESEVAEQQFAIGDATLARAIREQTNFQVDGQFNSDAYQAQLRASGMTVPEFEQSYRDNTAIGQFQSGISETAFVLPQEAERLADLGRQVRTVDAVRFNFEEANAVAEVSDEDVVAYFEEQKGNYLFPERAKIQYIELDSSIVASEIEISDTQAQSYYDDNRGRYIAPERREASHILLESGNGSEDEQVEQLNQIRERVLAGESFADLASEFSDDIGSANSGGSLGFITPGAMVPEFEDAVSALSEIGDISEPVISDFGVHLIKLDSITAESGQAFDEVKSDIIATMQQDEADREFFDLRDLLSELSFDNPGSLEPAADATGLEIKTSDWLGDNSADSGPVLSSPAVMAAAFGPDVLEDENNSDIISIDNRHIVVLRVAEYEEERPQTLEEVREDVVDALKAERTAEQLLELADAALEKLKLGESSSVVAEGSDLAEAFESEVIGRQSTVFDRNAIARIFALPRPDATPAFARVTLANGDELAVSLKSVEIPAAVAPVDASTETLVEADSETPLETAIETQVDTLADTDALVSEADVLPPVAGVVEAGANPRLGALEFEALLENLRTKADVEISNTPATSGY